MPTTIKLMDFNLVFASNELKVSHYELFDHWKNPPYC